MKKQNSSKKQKVEKDPFYKSLKVITGLSVIILFSILYISNNYILDFNEKIVSLNEQIKSLPFNNQNINMINSLNNEINSYSKKNMYLNDLKNICFGVIVGLIFSFLLSINEIRSFLIKSISNFMSDGTYLSKLNKKELIDTINLSYSHLNGGVDISSNKESLFNYLKKLDEYLITPHKSIVSESLTYEYFDKEKKLFLAERIQDFRIHTLDINEYNKFDIIYRYYGIVGRNELDKFKDNHSVKIYINGKEIVNLKNLTDTNESLTINKYNDETEEYNLYFHKEIKLEDEFTQVKIISKKVETIDNSIAMANTYATYTANYDITLPEDIFVENIFHNNTLSQNGKIKQITTTKNKNHAHINMNGWQLPGLSFVLTYKK